MLHADNRSGKQTTSAIMFLETDRPDLVRCLSRCRLPGERARLAELAVAARVDQSRHGRPLAGAARALEPSTEQAIPAHDIELVAVDVAPVAYFRHRSHPLPLHRQNRLPRGGSGRPVTTFCVALSCGFCWPCVRVTILSRSLCLMPFLL